MQASHAIFALEGIQNISKELADKAWAPQDTRAFLECLMEVWDTALEENPKLRKK